MEKKIFKDFHKKANIIQKLGHSDLICTISVKLF